MTAAGFSPVKGSCSLAVNQLGLILFFLTMQIPRFDLRWWAEALVWWEIEIYV